MNTDTRGVAESLSRLAANSDLKRALEAARAGAEVVAGGLGQQIDVSYKGDADPVTEVDHCSEQAILEVLARHFSDDRVVREEGGGELPDGGRVWLVDPLDGTTNFVHGFPWAGVSVALWIDNVPSVGVVIDVNTGDEYTAVAGGGARRNGSPIGVSGTADLGEALIVTGFPYDRAERIEICDSRFRRVLAASQGTRRLGAASLDMCMVACGKLDGYWEEDLLPWDLGAGVLIVQEAGGTVTNFSGQPVDPAGLFVVASNGAIHGRFLETLRGESIP